MHGIEQALISFFEHVAQRDEVLLEKMEQEVCFSLELAHWRFTLPDLFDFLKQEYECFASIEYKQFRQLIFKCPVNQTLKPYGAEIRIAENRKKVDQSTYMLAWPTK